MRIGDRVVTAIGATGVVTALSDNPPRVVVRLEGRDDPVSYPPSLVRLDQEEQLSEQEQETPGGEIAVRGEPPMQGTLAELKELGWWLSLAESGQETPAARGAAAALRFYFVRELGLPPLAAAEVSVIKGRLFVQSKLLRALAARAGYRIVRTKDSNDESCTAVVIDERGVEVGRSTFTLADAKRAGLVRDRSAWTTHPGRMLWARAAKFAIDDYAPEVSLGLATDDERAEILDQPFVDEILFEPEEDEQIEFAPEKEYMRPPEVEEP